MNHESWCEGGHLFDNGFTCEYVARLRWVSAHRVSYCPKSATGYHTFHKTADYNSPCGHHCGAVYGDLVTWQMKIPVSTSAPFYPNP